MTDIGLLGIVATLILLLLSLFIMGFMMLFQRRQQKHLQEKMALKAQYDEAIRDSEQEIQEQTMKHISRELHDNVAQMLTLVKIQLSSLQRELPQHPKINSSKEYITSSIDELRALSKTLNNDSVLQEGLGKAIDFELKRIEKIGVFQLSYEQNYEQHLLDRKQEIVVFRIFQELIQNTIKHAQAKKVRVSLQEDKKALSLSLEDDGIGFDFEAINRQQTLGKGSGLGNIQYRVSLLKGTFEVGTSPMGGSLSVLKIPYEASV